MANYDYSGLVVVVRADTGQLRRDIQKAATQAGQEAGRSVSKGMAGGTQDAVKSLSRSWTAITTNLRWQFRLAAQDIQRGMGRAWSAIASQASRVWARLPEGLTSGLARAWSAVTTQAGRAAAAVQSAWGRVAGAVSGPITTGLGRAWSAVTGAAGRAAEATGAAFTRAAGAAGNAVSTALGRAFSSIQTQAARAAEAISGPRGLGALAGMGSRIKTLAAGGAVAMGALAVQTIRTGIEYNSLSQRARAAFTTILGSAKAADQMMERITRFARTSPFPRQAFIEATQQMISFGVSANRVIPYLTSIQDAVAATGGTAQTLSEITLVMSQIQAAGRITGVDLMQFAQRGINAADLIGLAMGKTGTQIKDQITAGTLDATTALDALSRGMEKRFGGAAANVKNTWVGTTDRIKGAMRDIGGAIVAPFIDPKGGGLAIEWGNQLATSLRGIIPAITVAAKVLGQLISYIAQGLAVLVMGFMKLGPLRNIILGLAAAWAAFNIVMAISPLGWVIIAVVGVLALIGVIWKFRAAIVSAMLVPLNWVKSTAQGVWTWIARNWPLLTAILTGPVGLAVYAIVRNWSTLRAVTIAVWNAIKSAVAVAYNNTIRPVISAFNLLTNRNGAAQNALRNTTGAAWRAIGTVIRGVYNATIAPVMRGIQTAAARTGQAFQRMTQVIRSAWNGVRGAVAAPARYVAFSIINPLLNGANKLLSKLKMSIPLIPRFSSGGLLPGYGGGDRLLAMLEAGEAVVPKDRAKSPWFRAWAKSQGIPGFQTGGLVGSDGGASPGVVPPAAYWNPIDWAKGLASGAGNTFKKLGQMTSNSIFDPFFKAIQWGAYQGFKLGTKPLTKLLHGLEASPIPPNFFRVAFGKLGLMGLGALDSFLESKSAAAGDATGIVRLAMRYNGRPYRWGGGANPATGFDCSSFINYLAGMSKLPAPGGFRAPSAAHGPVTTDWMAFNKMQTVSAGNMAAGDIFVNSTHMGLVTGKNRGFAARSTATGIGPQTPSPGYMIRRWPGMYAGPGGGTGGFGPMGPIAYQRMVRAITARQGIPHTANAWISQMRTESNFNPRAINNWDSNARAGTPSKGLMQVIDPTFAAYCAPYCGRGIWDPFANIWAAVRYGRARYGANLLNVIGRGHGYAQGGILNEPVWGIGIHSGQPYSFGEQAPRVPELWSPLTGSNQMQAGNAPQRVTINVYPQRGQSEVDIAAAVSRRLSWAVASGRA